MDENTKKIQTEIAKDKIQIILSSIALAVLIIMEFYIMINFKSNFMAMAVGILLMIVALFFLISAILDMSLKQKNMEQEKYEEIYNAQKASYLVIKKSFDEMEQRLRVIEENSSLPAEDIINAQKAVAKVTISRSKENTDALMNSNDELINQLVNIQEKLDSNNSQMIEKQQSMIKESNFDIQQKIAALTSQISNIEGRIQSGVPVMAAQPVQMTPPPVMPEAPVVENPVMEELPVMDELPSVDEIPVMDEIPSVDEMPAMDELPQEDVISTEDMPVEETDDLGLDLDAAVEDAEDEIGIDLDAVLEEEPASEEIAEAEPEEVVDDLGLDLDAVVEEAAVEEAPAEELSLDEPVSEELPVMDEILVEEELVAEELPAEEPVIEEQVEEIQAVEEPVPEPVDEIIAEAPAEEIIAAEPEAEEVKEADIGANLDALLEEIGETVTEEEPEPEPEAPAEPEPAEEEAIVIPDVGVDLTDPNRVMSPEEIEKLFASI